MSARPEYRPRAAHIFALPLLALSCASGPSERAAAPKQAIAAAPAELPAPDHAHATVTPATATVIDGWTCPPGPYPVPVSGSVTATKIPNTEPTALAATDTGFHLYEGAVWRNDSLYFSDFRTTEGFPSRILRFTPGKPLEVAVNDSGSNGLALAPDGVRLAGARHKPKSIAYVSEDGSSTTIASQYQGKGFNSPNDLVFRSDGHVYFTDPDFQAGKDKPQSTTNVYHVTPAGEVTVVDTTIANPNGIALSPDGATLYVAGNLEKGFLKTYPVAPDGSVGPGKILLDGVVVPDGMTLDCAGNIYVTEHTERRIRVVSPSGAELGRIVGMDKNVTNVAFGGPERKTLYITGTGGLFQLELPLPGYPY